MTTNQKTPSPYEQLGNLLLIILGVCTLVATIITLMLMAFGLQVMAAIVGTATVCLFLLLIVTASSVISSHRAVRIMKEGANIALQAQAENDRWDTQKAKVFADIFTQGAKVSASHRPAPAQLLSGQPSGMPPLPLPSQDSPSWLPPLSATTIDAEPPIELE